MAIKNFLSILKNSENLPEPAVYYKILVEIEDIPEDVKERCYSKILKSSEWSYKLRRDKKEISSDTKKKLELKVCEDPQGAYLLRSNIKDLSKKIKKLSEFKACKDPYWGYLLGKEIGDFSFLTKIETKKIINKKDLHWDYLYPSFWIDITNWNVSQVTNLSNIFKNCRSFNQDISGWGISTLKPVEKEEELSDDNQGS